MLSILSCAAAPTQIRAETKKRATLKTIIEHDARAPAKSDQDDLVEANRQSVFGARFAIMCRVALVQQSHHRRTSDGTVKLWDESNQSAENTFAVIF